MKVYLKAPDSRGIKRVESALVKYLPDGVEITEDYDGADLVIIHVIGRYDRVVAQVAKLRVIGKPYIIIQYCIRSTQHPDTKDWIKIWQGAKLVWSYYDLPQLCIDDGIRFKPFDPPNFYHSPLGAEADVFYPRLPWKAYINKRRNFVIAASSQHALAESARECAMAAIETGKKMFFLGHELRRGDQVICRTNLTDNEVAKYYSDCEFVSGLRRVEGFELPAAEGILCGARPVLFDKPHYRKWFDGLAIFIPEGSREEVIKSLIALFEWPVNQVTGEEIAEAKKRFNWQTIIKEFWNRANIN